MDLSRMIKENGTHKPEEKNMAIQCANIYLRMCVY